MKRIPYLLAASAAALGLGAAAYAYDGEQYVTCHLNPDGDNFLALRTCPNSGCDMVKKLGPATFVVTMEPHGTKGWREVIVQQNSQDWSYSGPKGWVFEKYICLVDLSK